MITAPEPPPYVAFRDQARCLLAAGVPPQEAIFDGAGGQGSLFGGAGAGEGPPPVGVPKEYRSLAKAVACHRDTGLLRVLYSALWRLLHGEPRLLADPADPDARILELAAKAVKRDIHKMKAFVRFRKTEREGVEEFIAWHRPDHRIVHLAAPFFAARFGSMRWTILTPDDSVSWDLERLQFGPQVPRSQAPGGDELEDLWRTYYGAVFNPARLMVNAMVKELPVRHWATLPEARLIPGLIREAEARSEQMRKDQPLVTPVPAAKDLPTLGAFIHDCTRCELYEKATQAVFGSGPAQASLMLVGEQPGNEEDLQGQAFVGPAGRLLSRALEEAGIDRQKVYITNAVKHFYFEPRGKARLHKKPRGTHVAACHPWLDAELEIVKPRVIVPLGATASLAVLGREVRIGVERGQAMPHASQATVVVTNHPSYILRIRDKKAGEQEFARMVEDLRLALRLSR